MKHMTIPTIPMSPTASRCFAIPGEAGKFGELTVGIWDGYRAKTMREGQLDVYSVFRQGVQILKSLDKNFFISAGTCLGLVRENDFIPHDGDLDVEILSSHDETPDVKDLVHRFYANGFTFARILMDGVYPTQLAFLKKNIVFDVQFSYKCGEYAETPTEAGTVQTPLKFLEPLVEREVLLNGQKVSLPMPNAVEDYLEYRYGSDWRIPRTSKDPWEEDTKNLV